MSLWAVSCEESEHCIFCLANWITTFSANISCTLFRVMLGSAHDQVPLPVDVVETLKDTNVSFFQLHSCTGNIACPRHKFTWHYAILCYMNSKLCCTMLYLCGEEKDMDHAPCKSYNVVVKLYCKRCYRRAYIVHAHVPNKSPRMPSALLVLLSQPHAWP